TGPLTPPSANHAAVHEGFDFELFRIFGAASFQRQTAMRAGWFRFWQINELLMPGQVAVITAPGSRLAGLSSASPLGLGVGGILEFIGAVATGLLLGVASKPFGLQLANLTAELLIFLFQRRESPHRIGMSALPIAGLLAQFQILPPQPGYFGAQLIYFCQEPRNQRR